MTIEQQVHRRLWTSLSPTTAAVAGCSLAELQQAISRSYRLDDQQISDLARYFNIREAA